MLPRKLSFHSVTFIIEGCRSGEHHNPVQSPVLCHFGSSRWKRSPPARPEEADKRRKVFLPDARRASGKRNPERVCFGGG